MIEYNTFKKLWDENEDQLPLLTLDEFFADNSEEDSLAPNQWEEGRPALAEIWHILQKLETTPGIAWVRVALHDDTEIDEEEETLILAGDSILLCTKLTQEELENLIDCQKLCSDGILKTEFSELGEIYSRIPSIPERFHCFEIVWD